jgi:peptidoglycan/LPS O-acetylase OafA/YrhL
MSSITWTKRVVPDSTRGSKILFLEAVRGVAAALVVLQHLVASTWRPYGDWSEMYFDLGRAGVVAFFLVSGYVIPLSLSMQNTGTFLVRRFFRLFPVYWLGLAAYLLLADAGTVAPFSGVTLVANVLMVQGLLGMTSLLPVAWTLSIELFFYAQQLGCKLMRLARQSVYLGYFWLAVYLGMCAVQVLAHEDMPTTLPMLLFVACLGHAIHLRDADGSRAPLALCAAGLLAVPLGAFAGYNGGEWNPFVYSASFVGGLVLFGVFYARRERRTPSWLVVLGAWSYAMYLAHPIVSEVLAPLKGPVPILFMTFNALAVLAVSWAAHQWVEKPSVGLGRALTSDTKAPAHRR